MKADFERALLEQATEASGTRVASLTSGHPRMLWPHEARGGSMLVDGGEAKFDFHTGSIRFSRAGSWCDLVVREGAETPC